MDSVQPLVIVQSSISAFQIPFIKSFSFAGNILTQRTGFYLTLISADGFSVRSEASPLPGVSLETLKHCRHELEEIQKHLKKLKLSNEKDSLIDQLSKDSLIRDLCPSVRFAVESACFLLAAKSQDLSLAEFLESKLVDVPSAALLQGTYDQVIADAKQLVGAGVKVFKLKVGDRNIPLDVKKVQGLKKIIPKDGLLRLDGNRVWSLKEALLFVELVGRERIEFMEEPLSDISKLNEFYQQTHMPLALDETLSVLKCGITAPGRCSPTLANHEGVKAYILKPMLLSFLGTLLWIQEARSLGKKAIISSSFESAVGIKILANLAIVTEQIPGLGTARWLNTEHLVNTQGVISKDFLR